MTIVRWDPFRDFGFTAPNTWVPPVDIFQTGDHELVLKAELPDMTREDIDITVENFVLTIKGEKKLSSEVKEEQFHHVERRYGAFSRSFSLPRTVDAAKVSAAYRAKQLRRGARLRILSEEGPLPKKAERLAMEEVKRGLVMYDVPPVKGAARAEKE